MYVGKKFTATRTKTFEMEFRCPRCRFSADAIVIGVGQGAGNSPYMLDNDGAAERARHSAENASFANAELILRLAPCERCKHRSGLLRFWLENLLGGGAVLLGFWGLAALVSGGRSSSSAYWIFGVTGLFTLAFTGYMRWIHLSTAAGRVRFLEPAPEAPVARPKKRKKKKPAADEPGEAAPPS